MTLKELEGLGETGDELADELYREHILDHYKHPRNFGPLEEFDIHHKEHNPLCGDEIEMFVRFSSADKEEKKVEKISFVGKGCAISQASASLLTEAVKNKTFTEVKNIPKEKVFELLAIPISAVRVKCALLSWVTLNRGIILYENGYKFK